MTAVVVAVIAAVGVHVLFSAAYPAPASGSPTRGRTLLSLKPQLERFGIPATHLGTAIVAMAGSALTASFLGWLAFGGLISPLLLAAFAITFPVAVFRKRTADAERTAADAWPGMIEEIRLQCGSLGKPIPQALIEVGKRGPEVMRPAFSAAEREWLLTTDFDRTLALLRRQLHEPTADAVCETLLVAHSVGGSDVERRLASLATDRRVDLNLRKEARAKQAGVRFARRFVLVVPLGMALVGMSIGNGRAAYSSPGGQVGVAFALVTLALCWLWAGRLIKLPQPMRVTHD